jgi:hypothetical protein
MIVKKREMKMTDLKNITEGNKNREIAGFCMRGGQIALCAICDIRKLQSAENKICKNKL